MKHSKQGLLAALAVWGLMLGNAPEAGADSRGYYYDRGNSDWNVRYDDNDWYRYGYARPFFGYRVPARMGAPLLRLTRPARPEYPYSGDRVVADVQSQLFNRGYRVGPVDGVLGGRTRSAIAAFQSRNNLPATGEIDQQLLRALLLY